jgi:hypothetical protein
MLSGYAVLGVFWIIDAKKVPVILHTPLRDNCRQNGLPYNNADRQGA